MSIFWIFLLLFWWQWIPGCHFKRANLERQFKFVLHYSPELELCLSPNMCSEWIFSLYFIGMIDGKRNCSIKTVQFHMSENSRIRPFGKYNGSYIKVCIVFFLSRNFIKETGKSASPLGILWIQHTFHLLEPSMQTT